MRIPDHVISEVADRLDMIEVVSEYVHLQKKGGRYWGLCPFHQEKTPSFTVSPDKGVYYCFGCHKGGSIYTFIMESEKISFTEAVRFLAEKAGVDLSFLDRQSQRQSDTSQRDAYLELYQRVAGSFHHILLNHKMAAQARAYLMSRGVSQDTLKIFQIGYVLPERDWLFTFLREKNYSEVFLQKSGLFSHQSGVLNPLFRDRIIFPIRNSRGEVLAFGGRALREDRGGPKYLNSPETPFFRKGENLFGPPDVFKKVRNSGEFIMVEGYMDVLALSQAQALSEQLDNCVAPLGTSLTAGQVRLLKRYAQRGVLLFDGDEAGIQATLKAAELCELQGISVNAVDLPEGQDPAEIIEKEGVETLIKKLKCPITSFQFLLNKALLKYDIQTPDGKEGIFRFLNSYLASIDSQVKRDGYFRILAEKLGVDFESVRNDFLKGVNRAQRFKAGEQEEIRISSDLFLLLAISVNRDFFSELRNTVTADDIEDSRARELYIALEECFRNEENSLEALLEHIEDPGLKELLLRKISSEEFTINQDRLIQDGVKRIKQRSLENKRNRVASLITKKANSQPAELKELLAEKIFLDEELQKLKVMPNDRSEE